MQKLMLKSLNLSLWLALLASSTSSLYASIIGTNVSAQPLTESRIAKLPADKRGGWVAYLRASTNQARADQQLFRKESSPENVTLTSPPSSRGTQGIPLNESQAWYASDEARRIATIIVSFQTPAGGWSKNLDMTHHSRAPGELFAHGNASRYASRDDLDLPVNPDWNYVGTFDNGATITQLRFLAKIVSADTSKRAAPYKKAFQNGLNYVFRSQFPNGGWPQVWPLQGGYHDCVTFNDGAMTGILDLLLDVSQAKGEFAFVQKSLRQKAAASLRRGLDCVIATQIVSNGQPTAWCQQYDSLTLQPASARNYEMPSISSGESAGVMLFLMRLPQRDSNVVAAVRSAATWFETVAIRDKAYRRTEANDGRHLVDSPKSEPIWSRYYEIGSNRPIFGDRDKSIHDTVEEISRERRDGYAWFTDGPEQALKRWESFQARR